MTMVNMIVPTWLEKLLSITTFFSKCEVHTNESKSECNMYCLDCSDQAFCSFCISSEHENHRVIQIRRSTYQDVVRVRDIYKHVDIVGIQPYLINRYRVVFLNERGPTKPKRNNVGRENNSRCETCERNLVDPFCFCSLACKVAWIKKNEDGSIVINANKEEEMRKLLEGVIRRLISKEKDKNLPERTRKRAYQSTLSSEACSTSRRKGIPRRAPFY